MKNLFIDFFKLTDLDEANIVELKRVLIFTTVDDNTIKLRHYEIAEINEALTVGNKFEMKEIGPHIDLIMRRNKFAAEDVFKQACKKPKVTNIDKKRAKKNMFTTEIGDKKAKVFIQ